MTRPSIRASLAVAALLTMTTALPAGARDVIVVYDASGSMWGQIGGVTKIEIARGVLAELVQGWSSDINLGLVAYGHRHKGRCDDIETLVPPGPLSPDAFMAQVNAIQPLGRTPLSAAVQHAAEVLRYQENAATVVLISDGIENCQADPCALSAELARQGLDFTAHVIGFDVKSEEYASLACIAENSGGVFLPAEDAAQLRQALEQVQSVIEQEQTEAEPAPAPAPEPALRAEVTVTAPEQVLTGADFDIAWTPSLDARDILTVLAQGTQETEIGTHIRVRDKSAGVLTAPAYPGLYEVRYVQDQGRATLGYATLEVVEPELAIIAPQQATSGALVEIAWSSTVNERDIITIVPLGAKEDEIGEHRRAGRGEAKTALMMPGQPGLYEVRYVLEEGRRTMASTQVEVVEAALVLTAPAQAQVGQAIAVSWSGTVNERDIITIVPLGAKDGEIGEHRRAGNGKPETSLTAPGQPGLYEVRYVLEEGRATLARAELEVVEAAVSLTVPAQAIIGQAIEVSWSGTVNRRDIITIVPLGSKEGEIGEHRRAGNGTPEASLTVPGQPGLYEVRYVLEEGRATLASAQLEVIDATVSLAGPAMIRAKDRLTVTWDRTINARDLITVVPKGTPDDKVEQHVRAGHKSEATLKAPDAPGLYEVRYVLEQGRSVLGRHDLEVVAEDAALNQGVTLQLAATAAPGATLTVTWTGSGESQDQRLTLARPEQADFAWITAYPVAGLTQQDIALPAEPGRYEVRYLDVGKIAVLSRALIEVK